MNIICSEVYVCSDRLWPVLQIVRTDRNMEQIVFPIPEICEYLPADSKHRVLQTAERDDQGSKVADFFSRLDNLFHEMKWQKKLRGPHTYTIHTHTCHTISSGGDRGLPRSNFTGNE